MDLGQLDDAFGYLLRRAWRDVDRRFQHHFRTLGLTAPQYSIMILIEQNEDVTPGDLVHPLGISQNNLVGIVGDLIRRGYVRKQTCTKDRRVRILTLTRSGQQALAAAYKVHAVYTRDLEGRAGVENLAALVRLLRVFDRG